MNLRQITSSFSGGSSRSRLALRVAMWGIGVSVAVITIAQLIVTGFRSTIEGKLTSLISYAHVVENNPIFVTTDMMMLDDDQLYSINSIIAPQTLEAVVETNVVLQNAANTIGLLLVGTSNDQIAPNAITLSRTSARQLGVEKGAEVNVITFVDQPSIRSLYVDSIYSTGIVEVEAMMAYVSIETARSLSMIDSSDLSYYRIADAVPIDELREVADEQGLSVTRAEERAPHVYSWLMMIDQNMTLIFIIMAIVAIINVVTATLIVIVDNMPKIGILRALGMRSSVVRRLFVVAMSRFVVVGAVVGLGVGLTIGAAQYFTGFVTLDSDSYFLSEIPISFDFLTITIYTAAVVGVVILSILLPVTIISKLTIASTIKYE